VGHPPAFASLAHVFLFLPLVAAPLALVLVAELLVERDGEVPRLHRVARRFQPVAAALVIASFLLPKGALAGVLVGGWLLFALLLAVADVPRLRPGQGANLSDVSLIAAHVLLPVGIGWLLVSRLGAAPPGFTAERVFFAALHFHFSGFATQILIAATGRRLPEAARRLRGLHRALAIAAIAGMGAIVAGHVLRAPPVRFTGVLLIVASTLALAVTAAGVALVTRARTPRRLLLASAASLGLAMAVAFVYGIGELTQHAWIGLGHMLPLHGVLNAFGFVLLGLCGHIAQKPSYTMPTP
jgi:hypothetical protein